MTSPIRIALAGNPNAGKTTLFNALTGAAARTGNYPGVTVEVSRGTWQAGDRRYEVLDIPGTYSLSARSPEERVALDVLLPSEGERPDAVVVVADAGALARHLYFALTVMETGRPTVIALNMMDEARRSGMRIDAAALERAIGVPVVPIVARTGEGIDELAEAVKRSLSSPPGYVPETIPEACAGAVAAVEDHLAATRANDTPRELRARAIWALLSLGGDELDVPDDLRAVVDAQQRAAHDAGRTLELELIAHRYARVDEWLAHAVEEPVDSASGRLTDRIDRVLTHPVWGLLTFALVMLALFEALFSWSDPLVSLVEAGVALAQDTVRTLLPSGALSDLAVDGVIAGVGNVIVFVPQIALLFVFITVLEDSGYLARVAFVIDRVMRSVGLHGRSFVPLLSGFACAIPAIMATRTIESRRDRLLTMMVIPLMSCSARLPVYALVTAVVFDTERRTLGIFSTGALVLFAMYSLSVIASLGAAAVLRRTVIRGPAPTLVLELPPYRMPTVRNVGLAVARRTRAFLTDAGTIILAMTIILWALLSYPKNEATEARYDALRADAADTLDGDALDAELSRLGHAEAEEQLEDSFAGHLGHVIEPAIEPLGFDWRIGIGLIGSFAAREVLVSTLAIVWGIGDDADEESVPLREALQRATRADGRPLMTPLSGLALMVFFVLAAQCMSTIAVLRRESGSWRWPLFMLAYMTALAYVGALVTYQGGQLLGFT
ncbi:MAG: ferrous iron transport protein B [Sandaracinaceae bacterium]